MYVAKVTGHVVCPQKDSRLTGFKFLTVSAQRDVNAVGKETMVAVDTVGAGVGELVLVVTGHAARIAAGQDPAQVPVDAAIVGIVGAAD